MPQPEPSSPARSARSCLLGGSQCLTSLEANVVAMAEDFREGKKEGKKIINFAFASTLQNTILCSDDQHLVLHIKFLLKQFFRLKPNNDILFLLDFTNRSSHYRNWTRNLSGIFPESRPKCITIFLGSRNENTVSAQIKT